MILRAKYALVGEELELWEDVEVVIEGGRVADLYQTGKATENVLVMPALINAHAHLADCSFPDEWLRESLEEIVDPRRGLKRKALERSDPGEGIRRGMKLSEATGVAAVADFREGGLRGLERALSLHLPGYLPFARFETEEEIPKIAQLAHGLGLPEPDYPTEDLAVKAAKAFKALGKPVAVHLAEVRKEPVEKAFKVMADVVVHGCYLEKEDLEELRKKGVALAVCPRANEWFSLPVKVAEALEAGVRLLLGTDNCTFNKPDLWRELERASFVLRRVKAFDEERAKELLKAVTVNAEKPLKIPWRIPLEKGSDGPFLVLDTKLLGLDLSKNKYSTLVKRGGPEAIVRTLNWPMKPLIKSG